MNMGRFRGGPRGLLPSPPPPQPLLDFSIEFLVPTVFRVVLFNHPNDVHVLWVWSEVAFLPKHFRSHSNIDV